MPNAKVIAGSNRLSQTIRILGDHWLATEATWSDSVRQRFEERYLAPLESAVDSAVLTQAFTWLNSGGAAGIALGSALDLQGPTCRTEKAYRGSRKHRRRRRGSKSDA